MKKHSVRLLALLLAVVMVLSVMPTMALAEGEAKTFTKVTSADGLTTGQYVLVVDTGYAMGEYDNGKNPWITAVEPSIANDKIENPTAGIWTLTVSNDGVIMTDAKGTSIAPTGGNKNGISKNDSYKWAASFADGKFTFAGTGEDTVKLASNTNSSNKFRGYKNETIAKAPGNYPCSFTLYKLDAASAPSNKVATPTASPAAGEVEKGTEITFSCATQGATIAYATDGTNFTEGTTATVTENVTFTVKASKKDMEDSDTATFAYTVKVEEPKTVPISTALAGGRASPSPSRAL